MKGFKVRVRKSVVLAFCFVSLTVSSAWSQNGDMVQTGSDIPAKWQKPEADYDYVKREVMIPMRDGVKLPSNLQGLYEVRLAQRKSGKAIKSLPTIKTFSRRASKAA